MSEYGGGWVEIFGGWRWPFFFSVLRQSAVAGFAAGPRPWYCLPMAGPSDPCCDHWWAVFTEPRRELFAAERLITAGLQVYCPTIRVTRRQVMQRQHGWRQKVWGERIRERHRIITQDEALLPRYLFAQGDVPTIVNSPGVVDVVRAGREACPVPAYVLRRARELLGEVDGPPRPRAVARLSEALRWRAGDRAILRAGSSFAGLVVTLKSVARLDNGGIIEGWLDLFGQVTPVTLNYEDVERVISGSTVKAEVRAQPIAA